MGHIVSGYMEYALPSEIEHAKRLELAHADKPIRRLTIDDLCGKYRHRAKNGWVPTEDLQKRRDGLDRALGSSIVQHLLEHGATTAADLSVATGANRQRIGFAVRSLSNVRKKTLKGPQRECIYYLNKGVAS